QGTKPDWQTKFNERFQNDGAFRRRMMDLLQGMDVNLAESGFTNRGHFISALHVSRNLNIPFDQLKAKMLGLAPTTTTTTTATADAPTSSAKPMSLGQAIHDLRPTIPQVEAEQEAQRAVKEAKETERPSRTS